MDAEAPVKGKKWTRRAWVKFHGHGPNTSERVKASTELLWLSHKFPWRSREWVILQVAAHKLFFLDERRPAHRPKAASRDFKLALAIGLCLATGRNATFIAGQVEPIFGSAKKAGLDNRIHYLAKRTRKGLVNLSPAHAEAFTALGQIFLSDDEDAIRLRREVFLGWK